MESQWKWYKVIRKEFKDMMKQQVWQKTFESACPKIAGIVYLKLCAIA